MLAKNIHPISNQKYFASSRFWKSDDFILQWVLTVGILSRSVEPRPNTILRANKKKWNNRRKRKMVRHSFPNIPIWKITSIFNLVRTEEIQAHRHMLDSFASNEITSGWKWIAKYAERSVNNYVYVRQTSCHRKPPPFIVRCADTIAKSKAKDAELLSTWNCHNLHFK